MSSSNILLLRAPDSPDRYESTFSSAGYYATSVPVLETVFTGVDALVDILKDGQPFSGVVITSGRGCDAWKNAVALLEASSTQERAWRTTPFYVVGQSSASRLNEIHSSYPDSPYAPQDIRGESTGTSEQLANFILTDLSPPPSRPLLYLTGDKNRDRLPEILRVGGLALLPIQVYETQGSSTFSRDLKAVLETNQNSSPWWIVFFAPSAAKFVLPFLQEHFDMATQPRGSLRTARVAAIGPTTSKFLEQELHVSVDAVSAKPTPANLLDAISMSA
ncbi:Uroporphyrinogen-III synthase [Mycena chlorophos]|uniref:Uroporphyrinogen-III synthase n=1 Tax=Mycena chlorophos TaxID=658473 RepID=A0A8H6THN3_MYCCL|nr:Uroporphyrinogen-III synthase [Mycena chlorophos]